MGTIFQLGLDGIEAINNEPVERTGSNMTFSGSGADTEPDNRNARAYSFDIGGLSAMNEGDKITNLSTEDGQVAVVQDASLEVHDVPGYSNGLDNQTPTNTPIPGL
ncbi:MAG: hypothetical protein ACRBDL_05690 [Alphaproteobacteria bacterium]